MGSDDEGGWEVMLLERERFVDMESKSSKMIGGFEDGPKFDVENLIHLISTLATED